jgi:hypothetical protein
MVGVNSAPAQESWRSVTARGGSGPEVALLTAALIATAALTGCGTTAPAGSRAATLPVADIGNPEVPFRHDRKDVLAAGSECAAFTPRVRAAIGLPPGIEPAPMEPRHGCWAQGARDDVVSVLTTATPFEKFWRRAYPDDDGNGLTATMVDKDAAQLFERFIVDQRYYAIHAGSQWAAGLDSRATKTACMLVVDTGSADPLLITVTQQVTASGQADSVSRQCDLAATVAETVLSEQDPGGGSRMS